LKIIWFKIYNVCTNELGDDVDNDVIRVSMFSEFLLLRFLFLFICWGGRLVEDESPVLDNKSLSFSSFAFWEEVSDFTFLPCLEPFCVLSFPVLALFVSLLFKVFSDSFLIILSLLFSGFLTLIWLFSALVFSSFFISLLRISKNFWI